MCANARAHFILHDTHESSMFCSVFQNVAVYCIALQCVAVCCSVLQCITNYVSCLAVCCSVLQCLYRHYRSITALGRKPLAHLHCRNACQHITPYNKRLCIYVYMCTLNAQTPQQHLSPRIQNPSTIKLPKCVQTYHSM